MKHDAPPPLSRDPLPPDLRVGLLAVGRDRPGFDPEWGERMHHAARKMVRELPGMTAENAALAVDDASMRQAVEGFIAEGCDALIVIQPTMGDGRLVPLLAQLWHGTMVLWATTENPDADRVSACTLVGTHVFASQLRQADRPMEVLSGSPQTPATRDRLAHRARCVAAAARLRKCKLGLVGNHAPGFLNLHVDPAALDAALGVSMRRFAVAEMMQAITDAHEDRVAEEFHELQALQLPRENGITDDHLRLAARYRVALESMMDHDRLDAMAVRCWPELPNTHGVWPYLAFARLGQAGRLIAMEGDVDAAATLLMGRLLGAGVGYVSDWLEHDGNRITLWHQGEAPLQWSDPASIEIGHHFNNGLPGVVNSTLQPREAITLARLWRCDGQYHLTAVPARLDRPPRPLKGVSATAELADRTADAWFEAACQAGMPHHLVLLDGDHRDAFHRLARLLGLQWHD